MPDEFYQQYEQFSHPDLYNMVMAGVPMQVDSLLAVWTSIETTLSALSATLRTDLDRLLAGWDSPAGREFERRVGLVVSYAQTLADEYGAIHTGLTAMSSALTDARASAEAPDVSTNAATESRNVGLLAGSLLGPLGTLIGGVIGGSLGRERDEAEQENARQRMVRLVSALATDYRVTDFGTWPQQVPVPTTDLPGYQPGGTIGEAPPAVEQVSEAPVAAPLIVSAPVTVQPTSSHSHGHSAHPAFLEGNDEHTVPGVVTAAGPDPAATEDEQQWWGTAPAVAGIVGAAVAGTIAAAGAASNRDGRGEDNGDQSMGDGPRLDSDGVIRVSASESPVEIAPTPVEMMLNDGPKGTDLPTIDVDPSGQAEAAISALPTLESVSAHDAATVDGPSELAGGATGDGGPVEADNRSAAGPPPAHAAGLGGTPGMTPGATPGAGPAGTTPTVTAGTTSTPTSLATGTGIATPTGGAGATAAHTGATGGTTSSGGTGFGGGLEDRRWQTDGRMTWGEEAVDPTSITRPESGLEFDEPEEHA